MSLKQYTREEFLQNIIGATLASFGGLSLLDYVTDRYAVTESADLEIPNEAVILFQGDSITDAGRNRNDQSPNTASALGSGYAFLAASGLLADYPAKKIKCYNKGISGNKVFQLAERWDRDCIELQPDILSILVGVNDFWHTLDLNYKGDVQTYENDYRSLLDRTLKALPKVKLIIGEPFALKGGTAINDDWYPKFPRYRAASKRIAEEFGAAFIPYQEIFDLAAEETGAAYWSGDGVHPTIAGSRLMANAWMETVKRL
ncbi:SGNH/GDSL hydrolase family protein [Balneolaceae bacterium YR4-1]|uniref:SGNH/GDSL hydrolase family protein n=1 Tax=Halalkalibaculum roseum TaxID=2709311 RepID=A0A6M1SYS2_9BACT|nr:SGNH/GDSL hydrolase family protein [Halalkalibaculum roseum]NGP76324.1 SGNH/GDSL hydrolase family protein [Halalkalibaculum roseum]